MTLADKRASRQQSKREKQRKRRGNKQRERRETKLDAKGGLRTAHTWPLGTCYVSENWHDQGALVDVCFVRSHISGRSAVVLCEVDLAERGITACDVRVVESEKAVVGMVVDRSQEHRLLETSAEQALSIILDGEAHGRMNGFGPPRGMERARPLFDGVDVGLSPFRAKTGHPSEKPAKKNFWQSIFGG